MKPPVDRIRVSQRSRDILVTMKRRTGIEHWNVLCRWAVLDSLANPNKPVSPAHSPDSNVEMSWGVFGREWHEVYLALLMQRCVREGLDTPAEPLNRPLRLHLHRGIGYLATPNRIRSIGDLVALARDMD